MSQKIIEAHSNVSGMSLIEAKLNYIKAWQALPEYGLTYFLVKFRNSKKEVRDNFNDFISRLLICGLGGPGCIPSL